MSADVKPQGFTLLEILISLMLLFGGIAGVATAFNLGILASAEVENLSAALTIAQARMEQVKNTTFASITSSGPTADSTFSNFNVTVTVTGSDPKVVAVTVDWTSQGGSPSVILTTQVANY